MEPIIGSIVYALIGIIILVGSFFVFDKLTPGTLWKEIIEEHNTALAILAAAFMLSLALIISSAIHG